MSDTRDRAGIDLFRPLAALLVAAIHTNPLQGTANFLLVNVLARLAVPFFFMTGGCFTVTRYAKDGSRLWRYERRTALWYLAATLLYLPVNIRNGLFARPDWLPALLRDLFFDGTFYHLWYLPAAMLGCAVAYALVRKLGYPAALAATGALYLIGLFGDTLVGMETVPPYSVLLPVMGRTRNGIFFAPLFFTLGSFCRTRRREPGRLPLLAGFAVSLVLMAGEALGLRALWWGRNYAMTMTLPAAAYCLFSLLLKFSGKRRRWLSNFALLVYITHPMCIIVIRAAARWLDLWEPLVENSVVHFLAVVTLSALISALLTLLYRRLIPKTPDRERGRAWIELDLNALRHNVSELAALLPPSCRLMAVVKREAYGHGAFEIAVELEKTGVTAFAAATVDEAIQLRKYGLRGEILVLGYTDPARAREAKRYRLTLTLVDLENARALSRQNVKLNVHLKLDTGMHRLGVPWFDRAAMGELAALPNLTVTGVFTHLACSESRDNQSEKFTKLQTERFTKALEYLVTLGLHPAAHLDSTYGLLNYPGFAGAYVRAGLGLYGVLSAPCEQTALTPQLRPVLSLRARVGALRSVPAGEGVGYGLGSPSDRTRTLALLPIGYGDGYPRALSNGVGYALIRGRPAPVTGLVCMDMMLVDVTDIPEVEIGDAATLIGSDGEAEIPVELLASLTGTITNELLSRLGPRLEITTKNGGQR